MLARRSSRRRPSVLRVSLVLRSWQLLRRGWSRLVQAELGSRRGGLQMSFATGGSCARSGCACSGLQRRSDLDLVSLNGRLIPLLPAGRGGIGIFASLWLSRSRASRSFRILVSSRADRSDRLSAGWLRAARFRLAGCSAAGTAGPMSGTYAHPGVAFVVVLAISMTPKLFMVMFSVGWRVGGVHSRERTGAARFGTF